MEQWRKDARHEPIIVDLEALVPKDHLLRKIEKVMDYGWLYERLDPYYCHDNGRPGTDPVVLIKMVLIQNLFGIPSLRQTYREIQVNVGLTVIRNEFKLTTVSRQFWCARITNAKARACCKKRPIKKPHRPSQKGLADVVFCVRIKLS